MIPIMPSVSAPPPPTSQMHAIPQFLAPGFPAGLMHNPQMAALAMDPRVMAAISSAHQQHPHHQAMNSRAPSRQLQDSHKIHELTKAKENEQRQRQAATPKSQAPTPTGASTPQRHRVVRSVFRFLPGSL
uniref:Uncharacterized protein n=1 Tax=Caenorhabditis japonica TaxID=281687 RepID=A0A8R1DVT5_CAEJA